MFIQGGERAKLVGYHKRDLVGASRPTETMGSEWIWVVSLESDLFIWGN